MSLLTIQNLSHQVGDKVLYHNAHFTLHAGEHIGVIGHNGVGKSTLFKLLQAELLPDRGQIEWQRHVQIGYLDQHAQMNEQLTIREHLQLTFKALYELEAEMMSIYADPEQCVNSHALQRAADIQTKLESYAFYTLDTQVEHVAQGLGIVQLGLNTQLKHLSGGQRHKVILAALLLQSPDVLLLDEPTNYLDTVHIDWLADYLNAFQGAFMVISHDRAFLNRIATTTCDIDHQQFYKYKGNIDKALTQKSRDQEAYTKQYQAQSKQIEKLEKFIAKNGAGVNASIANGRKKQLARIERLAAPEKQKSVAFSFKSAPCRAQEMLLTSELHIGYSRPLLPSLSFAIRRGEKMAVRGFNGIGKSTLLKTLIGQIPPLSGNIEQANGLKIGYFEQELKWSDPDATPVQLVKSVAHQSDDKTIRQHLAQFGLSGKMVLQPISSLSGGEQTKVKLCQLTLQPTHMLILDEPTTHLDNTVKSALKQALVRYSGTLIVVSHEEDFIHGWLDKTIDIQALTSSTTTQA
ncbi:ABC-F family ATP-binding cassette domain-containing protein [Vibrio mimicus]